MLRVRLQRFGRRNYPSYRIVVAEHSAPIKGKFIENLGHYIPNRDPKVFECKRERVEYWVSKGAKPTDTVASLLKNAGMSGMEPFIEPRNKKKKKKKESPEEEVKAPVASAPEAEKAEEVAPQAEEPQAEEPQAEAPQEESPKEETPEEPPAEPEEEKKVVE